MSESGTALRTRDLFGALAVILEGINRMKKPVIARVHGFALGGGCGLAVGCDVVVASEESMFGLPEIKVGLLPLVAAAPVVRAVGVKRATGLMLTGEPIGARTACDMGLVTQVVPRERLDDTVQALARKLAEFSPSALSLVKEAAHTIQDMEHGKSLKYLRELMTLVAQSEDAKEGIAAFLEKRPPQWTGR